MPNYDLKVSECDSVSPMQEQINGLFNRADDIRSAIANLENRLRPVSIQDTEKATSEQGFHNQKEELKSPQRISLNSLEEVLSGFYYWLNDIQRKIEV
jgi:hypothetical protein